MIFGLVDEIWPFFVLSIKLTHDNLGEVPNRSYYIFCKILSKLCWFYVSKFREKGIVHWFLILVLLNVWLPPTRPQLHKKLIGRNHTLYPESSVCEIGIKYIWIWLPSISSSGTMVRIFNSDKVLLRKLFPTMNI